MGSTGAVVIFTLLALLELGVDKLPWTPARTAPPGLISRIIFGGLSGACLAAGLASVAVGALLGVGVGCLVLISRRRRSAPAESADAGRRTGSD